MAKTVVILVDNKKRDLPGAALVAHHLETRFHLKCVLQPLESWRSCLAAFKPNYILFNHLTASHLAYFSIRLRDMGILVGVLPNEGINYNQDDLEFNAGRYHSYAHIDQFFCWNEFHKKALMTIMNLNEENIFIVGVPRFDYYFEPWINIFFNPQRVVSRKPHLLICTNFVFAQYKDLPKIDADRHFSPWKDRLPSYSNYWEFIEVNARSRARFFDFLNTLITRTDYSLDLKPHPSEDHEPYKKWFKGLSPAHKERISLRLRETIFELLPACHLEISCERCTTALESWILGKPTIELVFDRHPLFFDEATSRCNRLCDDPEKLPDLVGEILAHPRQEDLRENRQLHLATWCTSPAGDSSLKVARCIAEALEKQPDPGFNLNLEDRRRALKLKVKNFLGLAYGSNPWKVLWSLMPWVKPYFLESKYITPSDVIRWQDKIRQAESGIPRI
ncbi:surface carbohydrate biosynthesis protein [Desulfobacca acetoxidans]